MRRKELDSPGAEALSRPGPGRHHPEPIEETLPGAVSVPGSYDDGLVMEEGYDEQVTLVPDEESTVHIIALAVDMEEEDRLRDEHDQAVRQLHELHQMLSNAPIVTPVVTTNGDAENGDENIHANHDDLRRCCGTRGRRWFAISLILGRRWFAISLILLMAIAIAVTLALVLQEPTPSQDLIDLLSSASSDRGVALADPSTPQYMAQKWIAGDPNLASYTDQEKIQRYALAALYYATNGNGWYIRDDWLSYERVCGNWYQFNDTTINCTTDGISSLDLRYNNLQGFIPPEIGMLSNSLEWLCLSGSDALQGDIPTEIGKLTKLTALALLNNSLIGTIPNQLKLLTKLRGLALDHNLLNGMIPPFVGTFTDLKSLEFAFNNLSGKIATELGILTKLTKVWLASNRFTSTIPKELGLLTKLSHLDLSLNGLSGTVPTTLASLTFLKILYLDHNDLTGSVDALCDIDFDRFAANTCGQVEIDCQCCNFCCNLDGSCKSI